MVVQDMPALSSWIYERWIFCKWSSSSSWTPVSDLLFYLAVSSMVYLYSRCYYSSRYFLCCEVFFLLAEAYLDRSLILSLGIPLFVSKDLCSEKPGNEVSKLLCSRELSLSSARLLNSSLIFFIYSVILIIRSSGRPCHSTFEMVVSGFTW